MEEAAEDGAQSGGSDSLVPDAQAETTAEGAEETPAEKPDFLLDKYLADGRTMEEATAEQAKGYAELQKRFGAFTGSPDNFEINISEELKEAGVVVEADDPLVQQVMEFAKESNMSQEGMDGLINIYMEQQIAESKALDEYKAEQMKSLGANADARVNNIAEWGSKNLDGETFQALQGMVTSAESVKAIEQLIGMTRNQAVDADGAQHNGGLGVEELRKMQFETDGHGNRKLQSDPEFRARYNKLAQQVYPGEHKQVVG